MNIEKTGVSIRITDINILNINNDLIARLFTEKTWFILFNN